MTSFIDITKLSRFSSVARINVPAKRGIVGRKLVSGTWKQRLSLAANMFGRVSLPYGEQALFPILNKPAKQSAKQTFAPTNVALFGAIHHDNAFGLSISPIVSDKYWPVANANARKISR